LLDRLGADVLQNGRGFMGRSPMFYKKKRMKTGRETDLQSAT